MNFLWKSRSMVNKGSANKSSFHNTIVLTKTTAAQNDIVLSYHRVRGLYFLAVVFAATMV